MAPQIRALQGLIAGLAGSAAVVICFTRLVPANASTAGFFFLIVVLAVATARGFAPAAAVSVVATLCYNFYFLPPVGRFTIADPENWAALFTFLLTAVVSSHLSDRAQKQAAEARGSQRETERLYALSRAILLTDATRPIGPQAAQSIAQIFQSPSVAIFDALSNTLYRGGAVDLEGVGQPLEEMLRNTVRQGAHYRDASRELDIWPIALGGSPIGALAATHLNSPDAAIQSMLNLVAIALERVRTEETARRAEAARNSEEFKSTLLDAIAHEFKTPLTSIKAAATGIKLGRGELPDDERELVSIIEEEADRLSRLVTEAVKMAEIDAGKVKLARDSSTVGAIVDGAVSYFAGRGDDRIRVTAGPDSSRGVVLDFDLVVIALRQLLDNALKYSPPDELVTCAASTQGGRAVIAVTDQGAGIPDRDRERIFDKFYRSRGARQQQPGTGLGLHIAREIARIHGGDVWVESAGRRGSTFAMALPLVSEAGQ